MKAVRLISLIARVALIVTMVLGLVFWIAQLFVWIGLLVFLAQISFPDIHASISQCFRFCKDAKEEGKEAQCWIDCFNLLKLS